MGNILLVEDETSVVEFIRKGLTEENFKVSVAFNATSALEMAKTQAFDLIILDIMLPDMNGVDLCKQLRTNGTTSSILFLSALGTSENIALGLNTGADDYLVKPFKFIELHARINALLRRSSRTDLTNEKSKNSYFIDNLSLNDDSKIVERGGKQINLTATEYRLLLLLLKNKGKVLSRVEILESAWDITFNLGTNVVDVYINYLRKKVDTDTETKLIHTVVGMGYILKDK